MEESVEVFGELENTFHVTLGAIDSFVFALYTQFSDWPFVTIPQFSIRAEKLRNFSNTVVVTNYYCVDEDQRLAWEEYSLAHDFWVEDGTLKQQNNLSVQETILLGRDSNSEFIRENDDALERNTSFMVSTLFRPTLFVCKHVNIDYFDGLYD